jgi:predicted transcriptional regulator
MNLAAMDTKPEKLELTRAEEEIMQILWEIKKGFVRNIVERFPDPSRHNTVTAIVKSWKQRFVSHYGRTHEYFPLVQKDEYGNSFSIRC